MPTQQQGPVFDSSEYRVIDCDYHQMDSFKQIAEYMPEPWRTKFERSGWGDSGVNQALASFFPSSTGDRFAYGKIEREHSSYPHETEDPDQIRDAMAELDLDATILISHLVLASAGISADDEREAAFVKGYIEHVLAEAVVDPDDGVYALAPIPYYDIDHSLDVLDRIEGEDAFVGGCFITAGAVPPLGNRKYDPIYERLEEMGLPVVYHTGGSGLDEYLSAGYEEMVETHTLGFLQSNMAQQVSVTCQGVPVKFPDLDIVFMESGVAYIPGLMARLDEEYLKRPEEAPLLEKRPSKYITEYYFGTQPLEVSADPDFLENCIRTIGTEQLLYASDYPHWDFDSPRIITELPFLSNEERAQILGDNATKVFGI